MHLSSALAGGKTGQERKQFGQQQKKQFGQQKGCLSQNSFDA